MDVGLVLVAVIGSVVLTAIWSSKQERRKQALEVLRIIFRR